MCIYSSNSTICICNNSKKTICICDLINNNKEEKEKLRSFCSSVPIGNNFDYLQASNQCECKDKYIMHNKSTFDNNNNTTTNNFCINYSNNNKFYLTQEEGNEENIVEKDVVYAMKKECINENENDNKLNVNINSKNSNSSLRNDMSINFDTEDCLQVNGEKCNEDIAVNAYKYLFCCCYDCKNNNNQIESKNKRKILCNNINFDISNQFSIANEEKNKDDYFKDFSYILEIRQVLGRGFSAVVFECIWKRRLLCSLSLPSSVNFIGRYGFYKLMLFHCTICNKSNVDNVKKCNETNKHNNIYDDDLTKNYNVYMEENGKLVVVAEKKKMYEKKNSNYCFDNSDVGHNCLTYLNEQKDEFIDIENKNTINDNNLYLFNKQEQNEKLKEWNKSLEEKENKIVAKVIDKRKLTTMVELFRARREIYFSQTLQHPNVLPLLLSAENDENLIMLFDHADKGDLHSFSKHKMIKEEDAKYLCKEVLKGLVYLHNKNIVHCDIKPQNLLLFVCTNNNNELNFCNFLAEMNTNSNDEFKYICDECQQVNNISNNNNTKCFSISQSSLHIPSSLPSTMTLNNFPSFLTGNLSLNSSSSTLCSSLTSPSPSSCDFFSSQYISLLDFDIKICDFGLAQICDEAGNVKWDGVRGSHGYIAPEVLHHKQYSTKVDCWALGIIVYTLLAGYEPFYPPSNCNDEGLDFDERYWSDVSENAKDFIKNILKCNQHDRMNSSQALMHPWLQC